MFHLYRKDILADISSPMSRSTSSSTLMEGMNAIKYGGNGNGADRKRELEEIIKVTWFKFSTL